MVINQDVIDDTVIGLTEYISFISSVYLGMLIIRDLKETHISDKLMYLINLRRSIYNYDYESGLFTDIELQHLLDEIIIVSDELPNNSNYGSR